MGFTALESVVAAGIVALLLATLGAGMLRESTSFQNAVAADALAAAAREEVRIAADAVKYGGSSLAPNSIATTLPMPAGSPMAKTLSLSTQALVGGGLSVHVRASTANAGVLLERDATLVVERRMPLPGSSVIDPTLVEAPFGAP